MSTVLLIHGSGSSQRSFDDARGPLESFGWQVNPIDLPGHGLQPAAGTTDLLTEACDFVSRAHPKVDIVIGHSLGALVALELTRRLPLKALILEEPPGPTTVDLSAQADDLLERHRLARSSPTTLRDRLDRHFFGWSVTSREQAVVDNAACKAPYVARALRRIQVSAHTLGPTPTMPTMLLVGSVSEHSNERRDVSSMNSVDRHRLAAAAQAAGAPLVTMTLGQGHCPHREQPREWANTINDFLLTHTPEAAA